MTRRSRASALAKRADGKPGLQDRIIKRLAEDFALIPKKPSEGLEVDVPGWIIGQIEQDIRAEMQEAIDAASKLAFDAVARDVAAYMRGWNEALAAVREQGIAAIQPMTEDSVAPVEGLGEPEEAPEEEPEER